MKAETISLSQSQEEYLEAIYIISQKQKTVRVKDLVGHLNVKSASVIGALKKLESIGLVMHEPYGYIELTPEGQRQAVGIYEKHQILYKFLTDILNIDPQIAEQDACTIEHHISFETMERMIGFIKDIESYQHAIISTTGDERKSGEKESNKLQWLSRCKEGQKVQIREIDAGKGALVHLHNLGLNIGNVVEIRRSSHMKGPVVVIYRDTDIAIGFQLANKILVEVS